MDLGVVQSEDFYDRGTAAVYGRVVFPLGKRGKRIDCTRLYELEIQRMKMELELLRMGTMMPMAMTADQGLTGLPQPTLLESAQNIRAIPPEEEFAEDDSGPPATLTIGGGSPAPIYGESGPAQASPEFTVHVGEPIAPPAIVPPANKEPAPAAIDVPAVAPSPVSGRNVSTQQTDRADWRYAQFGAFSTEARAERVREQYGYLSGYGRPFVRPVDLSDGTTIFKVMLGPLPREQARAACTDARGDCVLSRG